MITKKQNFNKQLRRRRTRAKILGTKAKPRLSVFRSHKYTYAQLIDDESGRTLVAASTKDIEAKAVKTEKAKLIGEKLAEKAKKAGINSAVFDRGHYKYHGRVKSLADGARAGGLKF